MDSDRLAVTWPNNSEQKGIAYSKYTHFTKVNKRGGTIKCVYVINIWKVQVL